MANRDDRYRTKFIKKKCSKWHVDLLIRLLRMLEDIPYKFFFKKRGDYCTCRLEEPVKPSPSHCVNPACGDSSPPQISNKTNKIGKQGGLGTAVKGRNTLNQRKTSTVLDARQKIIQKKRKNVVDARDILAKMAKKQDARNKILKIREQRKGENILNGNVQAIGSNILRKTDRNGKISLVTNKAKQNPHDLNLAVRQQLGLIPNSRHPPPIKKIITKQPSTVSSKESLNNFTPPIIRKTILNDVEYSPSPLRTPHNYIFENDNIHWYKQDISPQPIRRQMATDSDWRNYPSSSVNRMSSRTPATYIDLDAVDDEEMPLVSPLKTSRISNVHSRLDSSPVQVQSHGILAQPKTKVVVPAGHRIVVSNLHPSVTQDDIRQLFEDIGQLLVARLVRPGTAEVIYKNLKDAQKAVDTYHNRQLDGQPMKCLLVNKRPINNPTAPAIHTSPMPSKSSSDGFLGVRKSASTSNSTRLVPDLPTIHKVLFQRNN